MDWIVFDIIVAGVIIFFAIVHLLKGGISSVLSVASFIVAIIVAWTLRDTLVIFYSKWITYKALTMSLSILSIFIPLYLVLKIVTSKLSRIISLFPPLFLINRLVGLLYGGAKGFVLVVIFISIAKSYGYFNTRFFSTTLTGPSIEWGTTYMDKAIHTNKRDIYRALTHTSHMIRNNIRHVSPTKYKHYIHR